MWNMNSIDRQLWTETHGVEWDEPNLWFSDLKISKSDLNWPRFLFFPSFVYQSLLKRKPRDTCVQCTQKRPKTMVTRQESLGHRVVLLLYLSCGACNTSLQPLIMSSWLSIVRSYTIIWCQSRVIIPRHIALARTPSLRTAIHFHWSCR